MAASTRRKRPRTPHFVELDRHGNVLRPGDKVRVAVSHGTIPGTGTRIMGTSKFTVTLAEMRGGRSELGIRRGDVFYSRIPASAELVERAKHRSPRKRATPKRRAPKKRLTRRPARRSSRRR